MTKALTGTLLGASALALLSATPALAETSACLITKTDTNPFFVKMKEGAEAKRRGQLGIVASDLCRQARRRRRDPGRRGRDLHRRGCFKGILITPTDSKALAPVVSQARQNGLLVIALDTPIEPADAADATFATDNFKAGELIGQWAKATAR